MSTFVDSNILLYLGDLRDLRKREITRSKIEALTLANDGVISTQVLQEFAKNALVKFKLPADHVQTEVDRFTATFAVIRVELSMIRRAIRLFPTTSISFWDALIIAAAEHAGCEIVLSEDMNHGQRYGSVLVQNPFL